MMFERLRKYTNRSSIPVMLTAAIYGGFLYVHLAGNNFEPSYFVVAGRTFYDASSADSSLRVIQDGDGYDGQFYYRLAIEPFSRKPADHGITLDAPAYRQQRILYPLLAWIISAGKPARVPVALVALNYLGLCFIAGLAATLAMDVGRHALWGMVFAFYPGFILTLARDLTEIVASTFLLAGLVLARRSCHGSSAACLSLAVLARETTLLLPVAMILKLVITNNDSDKKRLQLGYYVIPIFVYVSWQAYLRFAWRGSPQVDVLHDVIGLPFRGIAHLWSQTFATPTSLYVAWCIEICAIGFLAMCAIRLFAQHEGFAAENISLILSTTLVVCLTDRHWGEDWAFLRASTEIFLLGWVGMLLGRKRASLRMCLIWIAAAVFTIEWRID